MAEVTELLPAASEGDRQGPQAELYRLVEPELRQLAGIGSVAIQPRSGSRCRTCWTGRF